MKWRDFARLVMTHGMRCWECPDATRYERGCTMGFRQGLGHDAMQALPTTCPVLTAEPAGFWAANRIGKMIERGAPAINVRDLTHAQLELAEVVQYELQEGAKAYDENKARSAERMAALLEGLKR